MRRCVFDGENVHRHQWMLSMAKLGVGQERYYLESVASGIEDYYSGRGESPGEWVGPAALRLGLSGEVSEADLRSVLAGQHPTTGEQLAGRPGMRRVPGWDLTFSAPKSVSLLYGLAEPEVSNSAVRAHQRAVATALEYLDREAVFSRRRIDGVITPIQGVGLVTAAFQHRSSRAGDPQLHTHVLAANLVEHADGGYGALHSPITYRHARTAGYLYQAILRSELTQSIGVQWTDITKGQAEIAGFDQTILRTFSKRTVEIEDHLAARGGEHSWRASKVAVLDTRRAKTYDITPDGLFERWRAELAGLGLDPTDLGVTLGKGHVGLTHGDFEGILDDLVGPDGLTKHESTFERQHVLRALCERLPAGTALTLEALDEAVAAVIEDPDAVPLPGRGPGPDRWTTVELLQTEQRLLDTAIAAQDQNVGVVPDEVVADALEYSTLSDEQRQMVEQLTTSGNGVDVIVGHAGAGKTYALRTAAGLWRGAGYEPIGLALAARAASELQTSAAIPSQTIARFLLDADRDGPGLDSRHVLVVDEAGMVDTRRLDRLLTLAQHAGAKTVLIGDHHQLPAIEAGGAFAALAQHLGGVELADNRRQTQRWEQASLRLLRGGHDLDDVIDNYASHGRIHPHDDLNNARTAMVSDWFAAVSAGKDAVMVAFRHHDVDTLNRRARQLLLETGQVRPDGVDFGEHTFAVGDRIVCLENDRRLGVHNSLCGTVSDVNPDGVSFETEDGRLRRIDAGYALDHLDHAYATTIHKTQGRTVDHTLVLVDDALNRQATYSALSRGRTENHIYLAIDHDLDNPHHDLDLALERDAAKRVAVEELRSPVEGLAIEL